MTETGGDGALVACVTRLEIAYLARSKDFMRLRSYDALAVVLYVASRAGDGVSEREVREALGMPRSTLNRLIRTLVADGQLVVEPGRGARVYRFNLNFSEFAYGDGADAARRAFYGFVLENRARAAHDVLQQLIQSRFGKL